MEEGLPVKRSFVEKIETLEIRNYSWFNLKVQLFKMVGLWSKLWMVCNFIKIHVY